MTNINPDMTDKTMFYYEVNHILDACRFGDHLTVTRTNGGDLTSVVSGPVICAPDVSRAIGIDLLDGETHVVRREDGQIFGQFLDVQVTTPHKVRIKATESNHD